MSHKHRHDSDLGDPAIDLRAFEAAVFDLDGVVTRTATVHAAAWKQLFDAFLERHAARTGAAFQPFDAETDYRRYVDGKPRYEGVRSFLESRGIVLPYGTPDDPPERETICGLGNRKNRFFQERLAQGGVEVFDSSVAFIRRLRAAGLKTALVSSSKNATAVLNAAGLADLFDVRVDGVEAAHLGLKGKPDPDIFRRATDLLRTEPAHAIGIEDAIAGVEAIRAAGFGLVVGVDRTGQSAALRTHGADIVVRDLAELKVRSEGQADDMMGWSLRDDRFDPAQEPLREALCTLGNGNFATRGAAEEAEADEIHYPGTYLAGGYNRLETEIAGRLVENEDLVNMPNWLFLTFRPADGGWLNLLGFEILSYRQELDLKAGVLRREMQVRDRQGRETTLMNRRIVHMGDPHLAAIQWSLRPDNWSGPIVVRSALDGRITNAGVARYRELNGKHLAPVATQPLGDDTILLVVETNQSHIRVAEAARTQVFQGAAPVTAERQTRQEEGYIAQDLSFEVAQGQTVTIEKVVALYTSRDRAISAAGLAAAEAIGQTGRFDALLARHSLVWAYLWQRCDIILEGKQRTQMILRLHIFHLLQTVSPHTADLDVGVPARGWHGEAYRGHVFWDELFIFPFLNLRIPELTRALLRYRYRRLPAARRLAKEAGYRGAMYPWQSGSSGREETQVLHLNPRSGRWIPDNTHLQRHVSAAVAYNVWRYYQVTDDVEFLSYYGAEMLIEIARFWASIATFNPERDRYEIRGVMGPDEFHDRYPWAEAPGLDNNAYTNVMAAWVLCRALDAFDRIDDDRRRELRGLLDLREEEIATWESISRKMFVPFHDEGILSQFEGYERLEEFDWDAYRERYGDIHRLDRLLEAEGDTVNRYKASKQADVLMLFYLFSSDELRALLGQLGYALAPEAIPRIVDYYAQRTSHGSTLSRIVDSWVLARADRPRSWTLLEQALESDIADIQGGTTPEGIHLGAMAGTVDLVQRGQTGLEVRDGVLRLNPCLPEALQGLRLRLRYRGHWLDLDIGCERMRVAAPDGWAGPRKIAVRDQIHPFEAGDMLEFRCHLENGGWRPVTDDVTHRQARETGS